MTGRPAVQVVVLAYGAEPYLSDCVEAVLASVDDDGAPVDLVVSVVDNGAADSVAGLPSDDRIRVLRPGKNLGFAGGCNFAVAGLDSEFIVFVNSDAIVRPDAVARLLRAVEDPRVALACGGVRLADAPDLMNSVGNPVHFVGAVWAGGYREPAAEHAAAEDVASVSGAFFAVRRSTWAELDGFDEHYFAYHEDVDLSLRAWLRGYRVRFVPEAVATHHYEFSRTPTKFYLLERNRWITVLTVFPSRVLVAVGPALIAFEAVALLGAVRWGFVRQKLRGYRWLVGHAGYLRSRRRRVQSAASMSGADFAAMLSSRIDTEILGRVRGMDAFNRVLAGYWALARRLFGLTNGVAPTHDGPA